MRNACKGLTVALWASSKGNPGAVGEGIYAARRAAGPGRRGTRAEPGDSAPAEACVQAVQRHSCKPLKACAATAFVPWFLCHIAAQLAWLEKNRSSLRVVMSTCSLLDVVLAVLVSCETSIKTMDVSDVSACTISLMSTFTA